MDQGGVSFGSRLGVFTRVAVFGGDGSQPAGANRAISAVERCFGNGITLVFGSG